MNQLEFDFGIATWSGYDADKQLGAQIDLYAADASAGDPTAAPKGGSAPAQVMSPFGFASRPLDPDVDGKNQVTRGCGLLWWRAGDSLHAMPLDDPRCIELLPQQRKGGSMQFGGDPKQGFMTTAMIAGIDPKGVDRAGSLQVLAPYTKGSGKVSHAFSLDVRTAGAEQLSLLHGEGMGLVMSAKGKRPATLRNAKGNRYVSVNDDSVDIVGKAKVQGSLTVGDQTAAQPVVLAPALLEYLQALELAVAKGNGGGPIAIAAPLANFSAEMTAQFLKGG